MKRIDGSCSLLLWRGRFRTCEDGRETSQRTLKLGRWCRRWGTEAKVQQHQRTWRRGEGNGAGDRMQNEEGGLKSLNSFFSIFVVQQISNNLDFFRMVKVIVLKQILVLPIFVVVCLMLQPSMQLCCHIFLCWLQFHIGWIHKMAHSDHFSLQTATETSVYTGRRWAQQRYIV